MSKMFYLLVLFSSVFRCYCQGQVVFANKVGTTVDAPMFSSTGQGLGPDYSAQLFLVNSGNSLTALVPTSTFHAAGTGAAAIADRYWVSKTVDVPGVQPGENAIFIVRVWFTAAGSYDAALGTGSFAGQTPPFTVEVGGGLLPPANLTTMQGIPSFPEPSTLTLGVLGGMALVFYSRRR